MYYGTTGPRPGIAKVGGLARVFAAMSGTGRFHFSAVTDNPHRTPSRAAAAFRRIPALATTAFQSEPRPHVTHPIPRGLLKRTQRLLVWIPPRVCVRLEPADETRRPNLHQGETHVPRSYLSQVPEDDVGRMWTACPAGHGPHSPRRTLHLRPERAESLPIKGLADAPSRALAEVAARPGARR